MKRFKPGDRVRCISKKHGYANHYHLVEIGKEYTVNHIDKQHDGERIMTLKEVDEDNPEGPFFGMEDFVLSNGHGEYGAYERAMRII